MIKTSVANCITKYFHYKQQENKRSAGDVAAQTVNKHCSSSPCSFPDSKYNALLNVYQLLHDETKGAALK